MIVGLVVVLSIVVATGVAVIGWDHRRPNERARDRAELVDVWLKKMGIEPTARSCINRAPALYECDIAYKRGDSHDKMMKVECFDGKTNGDEDSWCRVVSSVNE